MYFEMPFGGLTKAKTVKNHFGVDKSSQSRHSSIWHFPKLLLHCTAADTARCPKHVQIPARQIFIVTPAFIQHYKKVSTGQPCHRPLLECTPTQHMRMTSQASLLVRHKQRMMGTLMPQLDGRLVEGREIADLQVDHQVSEVLGHCALANRWPLLCTRGATLGVSDGRGQLPPVLAVHVCPLQPHNGQHKRPSRCISACCICSNVRQAMHCTKVRCCNGRGLQGVEGEELCIQPGVRDAVDGVPGNSEPAGPALRIEPGPML